MAEVTKVYHLNDKTTVLRTQENGKHEEGLSLEACPDKPKKDFLDALAHLDATLVARAKGCVTFKAAKPDEGKASKYFTLTGITMSRTPGGRRKFTASCKIDLGWGEKGASLADLLEPDDEAGEGKANVLTEEELDAIKALFEQARLYAEGERETQAKMDLEEGEAEEGQAADPFDPAAAAEAEHEAELAGAGAH